MKLFPRLFREESGQTLVFAALSLVVVLGFSGLAMDVGLMMHAKRNMQIAADSAAIAGAAEIPNADYTAVAKAASGMNGETDGTNGATVVINNGPASGPYKNNKNYVEALVSQSVATMFTGVLGPKTMTISARAVATRGAPTSNCIDTLGTTGTDLSLNGHVTLSAPACGIQDNSSSSSALNLNGNVTLTAKAIGVVGGVSQNGPGTATPAPVTGVAPAPDPLAFLPAPSYSPASCIADPNVRSTTTLGTSGSTTCFNGLSVGAGGNLTLNPGIYVINGPISVDGHATLSGTGVTFYLLGSNTFTGGSTMNLVAPTSGAYNGLLFYQPSSNTNSWTITGNSNSTLKGIVYLPKADVTFKGDSGANLFVDFIVNSLSLSGNVTLQDSAYSSINSNNLLSAVNLVE